MKSRLSQMATQGGPEEMVLSIISCAHESSVPVIFALSRNKLGKVCAHTCTPWTTPPQTRWHGLRDYQGPLCENNLAIIQPLG